MKKLMMVGLLLTAAIALQAQMKVAPKMEKGAVKTYVGQSTVTMPMQGDVKVNYETKYTIVDATADGYVVDLVTDNVQTECDANNIAGKLVAAAQEATKGIITIIMRCWFLSPVLGVKALCRAIVAAIRIGRMLRPPNGNQEAKRPSGSERSAIQRNDA